MFLKRSVVVLSLVCGSAIAQQSQLANQAQPLNATVSDFGTSFIFSPAPICAGCLEGELGFASFTDSRVTSSAITFAPFSAKTDFTVLSNVLDAEYSGTHFGDHLDFVMRQELLARGNWILTVAPRGTFFLRDDRGGRIGAVGAVQYARGQNAFILNVTSTRAVAGSSSPRWDRQISFDYYRSVGSRGVSFFLGTQQESMTAISPSIGIEEGFVLPFRNGQAEFATEQLALSGHPVWQFQVRVIANFGSLFRK